MDKDVRCSIGVMLCIMGIALLFVAGMGALIKFFGDNGFLAGCGIFGMLGILFSRILTREKEDNEQ